MVLSRVILRTLGLVSMIVLARLLIPADFGIVALGGGFAATVDGLLALGVEDAVVRDDEAPRELYDTAFTVSVIRGLIVAAAVALAAVPAGRFFHDGRLAYILYALAIATAIEGCANVGVAEFRRDFAFDMEFKRFMLPRLLSVSLTIAAAFILRNYWALIVGMLCNRLLRVAAGYLLHPFRPRLDLSRWRTIISYSSWTWVLGIVAMLRDRSSSFVLGRMFAPEEVGVFSVASGLAALPSSELVEPLCHVLFSGFAAATREGHDERETFLRMSSLVLLVTVPAGLGMSMIARPFVLLTFGAKWAAAVPVLQLLALAYTISALGTVSVTFLSARAQFKGILWGASIGSIVRIALLLLLCPSLGTIGAAIAVMVSFALEMATFLIEVMRALRIGLFMLARQVWRPVLAAGLMVLGLRQLNMGSAGGSVDVLAGEVARAVAVGVGIYVVALGGSWIVCGRPSGAETDALRMLDRMLLRRLRRANAGAPHG